MCDGWLSAQDGAALKRLTQGRLSAQDRALLRPLSKRSLSAEDWAALSFLRQTTAKNGTSCKTWHAHFIAVNWVSLVAQDGGILNGTRILLQDGIMSRAKNGRLELCVGTYVA